MKQFICIFSLLLTISVCRAQDVVVDRHPTATIYAIDYQTDREVPATSDGAILFKNAFIKLVEQTNAAQQYNVRAIPGHKVFVIKQVNPKIAYGYQLSLQNTFANQTRAIYSFLYNIDQNSLSVYDPASRDWKGVPVDDENWTNLNNCQLYAKFNDANAGGIPDLSVNTGYDNASDNVSEDLDAEEASLDASVSAETAPPPLPDYQQPQCPADGYLWQPGYWAYSVPDHDYYWVPGVWVAPPAPEMLWTPPYWAYDNAVFVFHPGYWGATVGFYGGINYGCGYTGVGFIGGGWHGNVFRYNTAVVRVNTRVVRNTYVDRAAVAGRPVVINHISFNGRGGVSARPTTVEMEAMRQQHVRPTVEQIRNVQVARADRAQFVSANAGRPTAVARPKAPAFVPRATRGNFNNNAGMSNTPAATQQNNNFNGRRNYSNPNGNAATTPANNNNRDVNSTGNTNNGDTQNGNFSNRRYNYPNSNGNATATTPANNNNGGNNQNGNFYNRRYNNPNNNNASTPTNSPTGNYTRPGTNVNGNSTTNSIPQPAENNRPTYNRGFGNYYHPNTNSAPQQQQDVQQNNNNYRPAPSSMPASNRTQQPQQSAPQPRTMQTPPQRAMQAPPQRVAPVERPARTGDKKQ